MKSIISIVLTTAFLFFMETNCSTIKTGKFRLRAEGSNTTIITRTSEEQLEVSEGLGVEISYKVNWLDNCSYQLYDANLIKGDIQFLGNKTDTLTVLILEVTNKEYRVRTTSNFSELVAETVIEIIEDD